jgi:hypothetical protein
MDLSIGIVHLSRGPLELPDAQREQLAALSDDLMLAVAEPAEHLNWGGLTLVAPMVTGGATLTALHALLLAARHPTLLAVSAPLSAEQAAMALDLARCDENPDLLVHGNARGTPPLPARLDQACLRPVERAIFKDPMALEFPAGLRVRRLP